MNRHKWKSCHAPYNRLKKNNSVVSRAHALSYCSPHHGCSIKEKAMKALHPDIDTAVFYAVTVFCAVLLMAL